MLIVLGGLWEKENGISLQDWSPFRGTVGFILAQTEDSEKREMRSPMEIFTRKSAAFLVEKIITLDDSTIECYKILTVFENLVAQQMERHYQ